MGFSIGEDVMNILVVNGPNLNLLGSREPEVYGRETLADLERLLEKAARKLKCRVEFFQSNHEGALIDCLHEARSRDGIILNPGGLTHSSVSLRDAVAAIGVPVIEVHLSNIHAREEFRRNSLISPVASGVISGLGSEGYLLALEALVMLKRRRHEG